MSLKPYVMKGDRNPNQGANTGAPELSVHYSLEPSSHYGLSPAELQSHSTFVRRLMVPMAAERIPVPGGAARAKPREKDSK